VLSQASRLQLTTHGAVHGPVIAVVGVWDPIVVGHRQLLANLRERARRAGLTAVIIALDPHPGMIAHGPGWWPVYCDAPTRMHVLRRLGVNVARMPLSRETLQASAADCFDAVCEKLDLAELWLGAFQRIGSGPDSSPAHVQALAAARGIRLERLPETDVDAQANEVRRLLAEGRIAEAVARTGYPPARARPSAGWEPIAWAPGRYRSLQGLDAEVKSLASGERVLVWPDSTIDSLSFVAGPSDLIINQTQ
jgi:FAD synthase